MYHAFLNYILHKKKTFLLLCYGQPHRRQSIVEATQSSARGVFVFKHRSTLTNAAWKVIGCYRTNHKSGWVVFILKGSQAQVSQAGKLKCVIQATSRGGWTRCVAHLEGKRNVTTRTSISGTEPFCRVLWCRLERAVACCISALTAISVTDQRSDAETWTPNPGLTRTKGSADPRSERPSRGGLLFELLTERERWKGKEKRLQ